MTVKDRATLAVMAWLHALPASRYSADGQTVTLSQEDIGGLAPHIRGLLAPATNQAGEVGRRETVARIIDPKAWEARDWYMTDRGRPASWDTTNDSLTTADAILAALATQPATSQEGEVRAALEECLELLERHYPKPAPNGQIKRARAALAQAKASTNEGNRP